MLCHHCEGRDENCHMCDGTGEFIDYTDYEVDNGNYLDNDWGYDDVSQGRYDDE